jgi:uncharacterized protein YegJ (DUF2314 family)
MEEQGNIIAVCRECGEKMYPNKGTFDVNVGDVAKLKFTDDNGTEYMWVEVLKIDKKNNKYEGRLDNEPVLVQSVVYNDTVSFGKEEILQVD